MFFEMGASFTAHQAQKFAMESLSCEADRYDFAAVLNELGIAPEVAEAQSKNETDRMDIPLGDYRFAVKPSPIDGKGLFATTPLNPGDIIAPARIGGLRTQAGRYTNHSRTPNALMVHNPLGDIYLVASKPISGYEGGAPSEEITIDYRQAIAECREASKVILCQQSPQPL